MDTLINLIELRQLLHRNPELSGEEYNTVQRIKDAVAKLRPTYIIENLGDTGLAVVYDSGKDGATIGFRCELDALPIQEQNDNLPYRSLVDGVSHKCGHDGHMAIMVGVAQWLSQQNFQHGKVVLFFQPAEENGVGARQIVEDPRIDGLNIDYMFALHNLPKEPLHSIVFNENGFSAEVQSFVVKLKGKESHASEPENGINPALAVARIIEELYQEEIKDPSAKGFHIMTPVHINMGQKSYGISPAHAELHYTARAWSPSTMASLQEMVKNKVAACCQEHDLRFEIEWFEYFPATINDPVTNKYVLDAVQLNGLELVLKNHPMRFGEDFGWFSKKYKTTMFGIGAGLDSPALHNADYDFPDVLIQTCVGMFTSIIKNILIID